MVEATIETPHPNFPNQCSRSSRGTIGDVPYCRLCFIGHDFALEFEMRAGAGTQEEGEEIGIKGRSSEPPRRAVEEWRQKSSREQNHTQKLIIGHHGFRNAHSLVWRGDFWYKNSLEKGGQIKCKNISHPVCVCCFFSVPR